MEESTGHLLWGIGFSLTFLGLALFITTGIDFSGILLVNGVAISLWWFAERGLASGSLKFVSEWRNIALSLWLIGAGSVTVSVGIALYANLASDLPSIMFLFGGFAIFLLGASGFVVSLALAKQCK